MANISDDFKVILERIPSESHSIAYKLIDELNWMQKTLTKLKNEVDSKGVIDQYQNGNAKDSVALKAYNTTVQRSGNLYKQLSDMMTLPQVVASADQLMSFLDE